VLKKIKFIKVIYIYFFSFKGTSSSGLKRIIKDVIIAQKDVPNVSNKKVKTSVTDVLIAMHKEKEENKYKENYTGKSAIMKKWTCLKLF